MPIQLRNRIEGDIAYLTLTKGYVAVVDATDAERVARFNWAARVDGYTVYAQRCSPRGRDGRRHTIQLHRLILGVPDGIGVDHIDGNGLNNRRSNLRVATQAQNVCNTRMYKNNLSGRKGVSWHSGMGKWRAQIKSHGKSTHLGYFSSKEDAYAAYCSASRAMHGAFGRTK